MYKSETPILTIIVPAYNMQEYISDCLDSLVNQSVIRHKIIIVNDGSVDDTEKICLDYEKRYPELISYKYQNNLGLGGARNTGMEIVETPYLCFLDSDDWLNTKFVEIFSDYISNVESLPDIIFTLPWVFDSVTQRILAWKDINQYYSIFKCSDNKSYFSTNTIVNPDLYALEVNACRKIYRTSFLKRLNFKFPEKLKWEDVPGHFYLLHYANTCTAIPNIGFFYRINQGGQITAGGGSSRLDLIPIFTQLLEIQEKNYFNDIERAYVIRLIVDFSIWSINVTNIDYIDKLLHGLHSIFLKLDIDDINRYIDMLSIEKEKESGIIRVLRSEEYVKLSDYVERDTVIQEPCKPVEPNEEHKRSLFIRGLQCAIDHGFRYTLVYGMQKLLR